MVANLISVLGQASLSDTCPVCTHTPVSPDLCKPNKALRTTLKAFLRTEEKKREKDRQSAAPPTPSNIPPADTKIPIQDAAPDQNGAELVTAVETKAPLPPDSTEPTESKSQEPGLDTPALDTTGESIPEAGAPVSADHPAQVISYCYHILYFFLTDPVHSPRQLVINSTVPNRPLSPRLKMPQSAKPH